jgi:hypothetical protein
MQWEPCRAPLLFASGVVVVAVALVAAVLAAIVDIHSPRRWRMKPSSNSTGGS